jgi:predicted nucleotidyltransferase
VSKANLLHVTARLLADLRVVAKEIDGEVAIFGSSASGTDTPESDVDVLVIGPVSQIAAQAAFKRISRRYKRPINVTVIEAKTLQDELAKGSAFWKSVLSGPTVPLKGSVPHVAQS